jgi:transposase
VEQSRVKDIINADDKTFRLNDSQKIEILSKIINCLSMLMPKTLAKRIIIVVMLLVGVSKQDIIKLTGISFPSLQKYTNQVNNGDIDSILTIKGGGRKSNLNDIEQSLKEELNTNCYHNRQQIIDMVKDKFGFSISLSAIARFLKKQGFKLLKCGSIPAKADPKQQRTFYETTLSPLIESAKSNKISLLFMDASHFVMGSDFLGRVYTKVRRFVKTSSGRKRYNVLGALDFVTKRITKVTNDTYITATQVCELLREISAKYIETPVYIILDNAKYQKCKLVQECAAALDIHLVYIPAYSPNLNLIERFWKHVKSKLRIKYYSQFSNFCEAIDSICTNINRKETDRLIGDNFQFFDDAVALNEFMFNEEEAGRIAA